VEQNVQIQPYCHAAMAVQFVPLEKVVSKMISQSFVPQGGA
jgi:hypothetical protein